MRVMQAAQAVGAAASVVASKPGTTCQMSLKSDPKDPEA